MKVLNREGIIRMGGRSQGGGGVSVGGGSGSVAGLASEAWVEENYISKAFFNRLFTIHSASSVIDPNDPDEEQTIDSIEALVGLWTEQYLSALGQGSGGGGGGEVSLNQPLSGINNAGLADHPISSGQTIVWNGSAWTYGTAGGNSVTSVGISMPTGFSVGNSPITSSGTISITFANGYSLPLTADVNKGVTAYGWGDHANAGYASASDVETLQGYFNANGEALKAVQLATSRSLWGQSFNGTADVSGSLSDTGNITPSSSLVYNLGSSSLYYKYAYIQRIYLASGVYLEYDSSNSAVKLVGAGFYTDSFVSALGLSGGGGGGGVSLNEPLNSINNAGLSTPTTNGSVLVYSSGWGYSSAKGIFAVSLTVAGTSSAAGFKATGKDDTYVLLAGGGTKLLSEIGGGGSVNGIKIGTSATEYTPDANGIITLPAYPSTSGYVTGISFNGGNPIQPSSGIVGLGGLTVTVKVGNTSYNVSSAGVVSLPAYPTVPTNVSQLTNDSGYITGITSSMVTTALGFTPANSTSLANYLPLSGGTLTGFLTFGRATSTSSSYTQTDNRINAINPDRTEFILIRSLVRDYSTYVVKQMIMNDCANFYTASTAAGAQGSATLYIGNDTLSSAANSKYGIIRLYGKSNADSTAVRAGIIEPTVLTANRVYTLPDKTGTFALTSDIPTDYVTLSTAQTISGTKTFSAQQAFTYNGAPFTVSNDTVVSNLNADKLDGVHAYRFGWVYNSNDIGRSNAVSVNDMVSLGNSNATFGMIRAATDNPTGSNKWIHVWSQQWTINVNTSWVSQIALGVTDKNGMWYRSSGDGTIVGAPWIRVIDSSNIGSQSVASATALQTARSLWGNSFDGTADISSTLTVDGSMVINQDASNRNRGIIGTYDANRAALIWTMGSSYNILADGSGLNKLYGFAYAYQGLAAVGNLAGGHQIVFANNGTVYVAFGNQGCWATNFKATGTLDIAGNSSLRGTLGVTGTTTLASTLTVNATTVARTIRPSSTNSYNLGHSSYYWANLYATRIYLTNSVYLEYDSTNAAVKIVGAGLYSDSYISALGSSSGGGGGSVTLNEPLNSINNSGLAAPTSTQDGCALVYSNSTSKWIYSNTATIKAQNISVSTNISGYTGSFGSSLDVTANLTVGAGNLVVSAGRAAIGAAISTSYKLYVAGNTRTNYLVLGDAATVNTVTCATIKTLSSRGLSVQTNGNAACFVNVAWQVTSDIRLKQVVSNAGASVEQIADAPVFNFKWLSGVNDVNLGSSAQYWKNVFPCAVRGNEDSFLSMDYGSVALAAAVITARKVVSHEERIAALEAENKRLRDEINELKAA